MDDSFSEVLTTRLLMLKEEIQSLQDEIQILFKKIEHKQEQAQHIIHLLASEGHNIDNQELAGLGQVQVTEIAFEFLDSDAKNKPFHYRDLTNAIQSRGFLIPGKDPAANLLSHISRDERFVRVAPGTYGLKKWGLEPYQSSKKRRRKRK